MNSLRMSLPIFLLVSIVCFSQNSRLFWIDQSLGKIQSANLDGSDREDVVTGLNWPFDIALIPEPGTLLLLTLGSLTVLKRKRR